MFFWLFVNVLFAVCEISDVFRGTYKVLMSCLLFVLFLTVALLWVLGSRCSEFSLLPHVICLCCLLKMLWRWRRRSRILIFSFAPVESSMLACVRMCVIVMTDDGGGGGDGGGSSVKALLIISPQVVGNRCWFRAFLFFTFLQALLFSSDDFFAFVAWLLLDIILSFYACLVKEMSRFVACVYISSHLIDGDDDAFYVMKIDVCYFICRPI